MASPLTLPVMDGSASVPVPRSVAATRPSMRPSSRKGCATARKSMPAMRASNESAERGVMPIPGAPGSGAMSAFTLALA